MIKRQLTPFQWRKLDYFLKIWRSLPSPMVPIVLERWVTYLCTDLLLGSKCYRLQNTALHRWLLLTISNLHYLANSKFSNLHHSYINSIPLVLGVTLCTLWKILLSNTAHRHHHTQNFILSLIILHLISHFQYSFTKYGIATFFSLQLQGPAFGIQMRCL